MKRRFLVPEVIQTSAMDCGPAALKALFAGFGEYLSYGRLREVCQTNVDGTSIDTLEDIARQLGLDVEQRMLPPDLLLLDSATCAPAIVVTRLANGATHFVVLWRVHGSVVQVMDPACGRIWMPRRRFLERLHIHEQIVPAESWHEWAHSAMFTASLSERMQALGVAADPWPDVAHLDAALRLAGALREAGELRAGREAQEFLDLCKANPGQIPAEYWFARPRDADAGQVRIRGAVLVSAAGLLPESELESLPPSLAAVRNEPPPRPFAPVLASLREGGSGLQGLLVAMLILASAGALLEALLFLGLLDLAEHLELTGQRIGALALVLTLLAALLGVEWSAAQGLLRLGRRLELALRVRLLMKIPALHDRYFQSRLISDMAFRAHALNVVRELPQWAGRFVRAAASMLFAAVAVSWFFPDAAMAAWGAVLAAIGVPLLFQPALNERDLRTRELGSALSRFHLDALLGCRAIQAHGAQQTMHAAHAPQLAEWNNAGLRQHSLLMYAEIVQMALSLAPIVWLVYSQALVAQGSTGLLLLAYWAFSIPASGRQFAAIVWNLPALRNTLLRYLEPLGAPEETVTNIATRAPLRRAAQVSIEDVTVVAGGHVILDSVNLEIAPGEHVGVVGVSGSGKSALVGLLLGWYQPAQGSVRIDHACLDAAHLARLRNETVWIDPQIHLFRDTLFENICYGFEGGPMPPLQDVLESSGVMRTLERLPDGLQSCVGEGGGLLAGGEGQRVRIARGLANSSCVRLAILDEAGRGLDRAERCALLRTARRQFAATTLFYVTHDISDTLDLDRVIVLEAGQIVEQGPPRQLWAQPASRYRTLLARDLRARERLWSGPLWRRVHMAAGEVVPQTTEREWTRA